jgi:hypothetical protein
MSEVRASAVSKYEKDYPDVTYVISELFAGGWPAVNVLELVDMEGAERISLQQFP